MGLNYSLPLKIQGKTLPWDMHAKVLLFSEWLVVIYATAMIRLLLFAQRNKPGNSEEGHS